MFARNKPLSFFFVAVFTLCDGALGPADCLSSLAEGMLAVLSSNPIEQLAREQAVRWQARGPVQVGVLEIERSVRVLRLSAEQLDELVKGGATFVRELVSRMATHRLPSLMAHPMERAAHAGDAAAVKAAARLLECAEVGGQQGDIIIADGA